MQASLPFELHEECIDVLVGSLSSLGWHELFADPLSDRFSESIDYLLSPRDNLLDLIDPPPGSVAQFYLDLCGLWEYTPTNEPYRDILISRIGNGLDFTDSDGHGQEYARYSLSTNDDWEFFIDSLTAEPALVFPGRFRRMHVREGYLENARRENQVTLSAVCVDIDSDEERTEDGMRPPVSASSITSLLSRLPSILKPSYITLTGNGVHLWYMFPQMPTGTSKARSQRRRMSDLCKAVNDYVFALCSGLPLKVDPAWINHGYRAPGSVTKYGDPCRCFCSPGLLHESCVKDPIKVYEAALTSGMLPAESFSKITYEDTMFKPYSEGRSDYVDKLDRRPPSPITEKQEKYISDLHDMGLVDDASFASASLLSSRKASELISRSLKMRDHKPVDKENWQFNPLPESVNVDGRPRMVKAHHFPTGPDGGGVYKTVLDSITRVSAGNRERALFMLAGIAYLMEKPIKRKEDVRSDFIALLDTPWGSNPASPLTFQDVERAITGYSPENAARIYKKSIIEVLGFNPFSTGNYDDEANPPQKRNWRTREEHLELCRESYKRSSREKKVAALASAIAEDPSITKKAASEVCSISYPTTLKYWDEALAAARGLVGD